LSEERVTWLCRADPDPDSHDLGAVRRGEHRVEIEFGHLGQVIGEAGHPQQHVG
jgi:hypothetical protein